MSTVSNPYIFTARALDTETGLMYYRARYYATLFGRFISRDPLGYVDGMNLYAGYFVPNGTDPSGTWVRESSLAPRLVGYVDYNSNRVLMIDTWASNHDEIVPLKRSKAWEAVKAERAGATASSLAAGGYLVLLQDYLPFWWSTHPGDRGRHWAFYLGEYTTCYGDGDCYVDTRRFHPRLRITDGDEGETGLGDGGGAKVPLDSTPGWKETACAAAQGAGEGVVLWVQMVGEAGYNIGVSMQRMKCFSAFETNWFGN